jgi:hypothetical protein
MVAYLLASAAGATAPFLMSLAGALMAYVLGSMSLGESRIQAVGTQRSA